MDPLSIMASVAGLLTAAGHTYGLLGRLSLIKDSPKTIRDAQREIGHTEIALRSMRWLLQLLESLGQRRELIQIDDLRITLADAMLAFSGFENMLQFLEKLSKVRVAISWQRYAKQIEDHLVAIQRHKSSLTFMLSILQW
jgi:hypothetical protein